MRLMLAAVLGLAGTSPAMAHGTAPMDLRKLSKPVAVASFGPEKVQFGELYL